MFTGTCYWLDELHEDLDEAVGWADRGYTYEDAQQYLQDLVEHKQHVDAASWQPSPEINAALQQQYQRLGRKPSKQQLWDVCDIIKRTLPLSMTRDLTLQHIQ